MVSLENYTYPIRGKLRFETDQIEDLNTCFKYGNAVKLGKTEWRVGYHKEETNGIGFLFSCNENLHNLWWRVEASAEIHIKSRLHPKANISFNVPPKLFLGSRSYGSVYDIWDFLMDQESGYLSIGKILVEVRIDVRKKYGFECPQKPIRKMTDSVILIDEEKFHVSRSLLSHHSSVLCDLFTGTPDIPNFLFDEISKELFVKFLELVHDWETEIDEKNIEKLLKCLNLLEADECIKLCDNLMVNMEIEDEAKIYRLIENYNLPKFEAKHLNTKLVAENPNEPYYAYVKRYPKLPNVLRPTGEFQFEFVEKTREMLEDSEMEHIGNEVLLYLSRKSKLLKNMCSRVFFKEFSDPLDMVVFHFEDGKSFYASKQIMAQFSQHFMTEFYGPKYKENDNKIKISDVKSEDFEMFLTFIYRPAKEVTEKTLEILYALAHKYSAPRLIEKCENFVIKTEKLSFLEKCEYSRKYQDQKLVYSCLNYRTQNLSKVKREMFLNNISKVENIFSISVILLSSGLAYYFINKK
ncbi:hypothetical protein B9Z55_018168 [Caenorhabditis nigoni]|uniref:BTB domain-containing protein n=1 Tax=Caenorhabditis nigoni TaxID=1611254 RepID=A0A2G5TDH6_9PELO|nr:hypothetical protein B9Z55_018168 [Caenorhabditis nigoni]